MEKEGQVTVFIIIGILILVMVGLFALLNDDMLDTSFSSVPKEARPIAEYTRECIKQTAEQGIFIMGMQGGYIELPKSIGLDPKAYIMAGFKVPYWYNKGREWMPSKAMMELELAEYINENLGTCIDDYRAFNGQYAVEVLEPASSSVRIFDESIYIETGQKLKIMPAGTEKTLFIDELDAEVMTEFGKTYDLAKAIMEKENRDAFLEYYTDEMIASSDWLPYEGMMIGCNPEVWYVPEMKEYTQTMIMHNLKFLQFLNTDYRESGLPYYDKIYKVSVTDEKHENTKVNVIYNPAWGMDEFSVLPSDGNVVKPIKFSLGDLLGQCMKMYHHKYSLKYPVLIQLINEKYPEQPFYFATPVIIRRNEANRYNEVQPWDTETDDAASREYCGNFTAVTLFEQDDGGVIIATPSVEEKRRNSLRITAIDSRHSYPEGVLPGVNISYKCIYSKCGIGTTAYPLTDEGQWAGEMPTLNAKFPDCQGGLIIAEKDGYWKKVVQQTVSKETDKSQVTIYMDPVKHMDFNVVVVQDHNGAIEERDIREGEIALISIINKDEDYEKTLLYPSDTEYFTNLSLIMKDLTYEVDIKLADNDQLVGGAEYNWTVRGREIEDSGYIEFLVYKKDAIVPPSTPEELYRYYEYGLNRSVNYLPRIM